MKSVLLEMKMKTAQLQAADINYLDEGEGGVIFLIHGFSSNASTNWVGPGWVNTLVDAGYRVIAPDNRGHGRSEKFYQESDYALAKMAVDVVQLMDHLEINKANLMGYSMGARISATVTAHHPERIEKLVLAGNGYNMIEGGFESKEIADGLLAESLDAVKTKIGRDFRMFAEQTKGDLKALAACIMGARFHIERGVFENIQNPALVTIGTEDDVAADGEKLASIMPNGRFEPIPKRNHMNAVGDKVYKQNVLEFLNS